MTTTTWKVNTGNWSLSSSWTAGVPGTADTALITGGTTALTVALTGGTIQASLLEVDPAFGLTFNLTNVVFNPATTDLLGDVTLNSLGTPSVTGHTDIGTADTSGALVINLKTSAANSPLLTNSGVMVVSGPTDGSGTSGVTINPTNNNATFSNTGQMTFEAGTALEDDPGILNQLTAVFQNVGTLSFRGENIGGILTEGSFNDPVKNTGTIIVDGGGTLDPSDTFVQFLTGASISGGGVIQLHDATMFEF